MPATGAWTIPDLAKGDSVTLVVVARVIANGTLTTTAVVSGTRFDPVAANNTDSASLSVKTADLSVAKSVDDATPDYLGVVVYTIAVANAGPSDATGVSISDLLPAGVLYVSDDGGSAYDHVTGTWTIGNLADGATATLTIHARVTATGTTANTASVAALDQLDPDSSNDTSQVIITSADAADIAVAVTGSNANPNVGQPLTISVKVTNHGPDAAAGVVLDNLFPSNLTYVSDDGGGAFDPATGTWTIGALPLDATVTLTLSATAATVGSSSDGASAVTTTFEADLTNNADSWPLEVHPSADLSLTKSVDNAIPHNGETVTYTLSVANAGPNAATGVIVADLLPAGLAWASDDGAGAYLHASGTGPSAPSRTAPRPRSTSRLSCRPPGPSPTPARSSPRTTSTPIRPPPTPTRPRTTRPPPRSTPRPPPTCRSRTPWPSSRVTPGASRPRRSTSAAGSASRSPPAMPVPTAQPA